MSYRTTAYATALAVSAAAGWIARGATAPDVSAPPAARPVVASVAAASTVDTTPVIAVASDGNVTLRVEQQPLEWVLEEIATQSGWTDVKARAWPAGLPASGIATGRTAPAGSAAAPCPQPTVQRLDAARVLQALERGSEGERVESLMRARSDGMLLPEQTLKSLYETDASERVRLAAFASYLEWRADRPDALREALEAALYVPSAAIQREAQQRLDELHETERIDALSPQGVP